jgi:hypothetical protein
VSDRVPNIVAVSDTHIGCKFGLCHSDGFVLDESHVVPPSIHQLGLWEWWQEFWGEFVPHATRGEPFAVVANGDLIDGDHHGSSTQFTRNIKDHVRNAVKIYEPVRDACEGRLYVVRGTQVHVGESGRDEEAIAEQLGAVQRSGQFSHQEVRARLGDRLIHFAHHISTTASPYARATALQRLATNSYVEAGRRGDPPYSMLVRSHRHQNSEVVEQAAHGKVTVVTLPAWQLKTPYVHSRDGLQMGQPEIGGIVIRLADNELFTRSWVRRPDPPAEFVL